MKDAVKERYDTQIQAIRNVMEADRERADEMRQAQQAEIDRVNDRKRCCNPGYRRGNRVSCERNRRRTKLYAFQKQQLKEKIRSGTLDKESLLRAKARLSRMEQQEEIEGLIADKKKLQVKRDQEIEQIKEKHKEQLDDLLQKIEDQEAAIKQLQRERREEIRTIDDTIRATKKIKVEVDEGTQSVGQQVTAVQNLTQSYFSATNQVEQLAGAIRSAAAAQRSLNAARAAAAASSSSNSSSSGPTTSNFAGGPIAAGTKSWVNELGKEAFLSASGKLSMIRATHGQWTAPTDGTIIPAHLTKKLDIPTGGININSSASSNSARAGSGNLGSIVQPFKAPCAETPTTRTLPFSRSTRQNG